MTKYQKIGSGLALLAALAATHAAAADSLERAFAPRPVPGLVLASLDIPVAKAPAVAARPAPSAPAPVAGVVPDRAPQPGKGFWERTLEFFGL